LIGQIEMEEDSPAENLLIPAVSHKFNVRTACHYTYLPKGCDMEDISKSEIEMYIEGGRKLTSTG
jgi:hypothetical protein